MEHWLSRSEWLIGKDGLEKLKSTVLVAGLGESDPLQPRCFPVPASVT